MAFLKTSSDPATASVGRYRDLGVIVRVFEPIRNPVFAVEFRVRPLQEEGFIGIV
jgi:hypothetical protein